MSKCVELSKKKDILETFQSTGGYESDDWQTYLGITLHAIRLAPQNVRLRMHLPLCLALSKVSIDVRKVKWTYATGKLS